MHYTALVDPAKIIRRHTEIGYVMRKEVTGGCKEQRKAAAEEQTEPRESQQRAAITDQSLEESSRVYIHLVS